MRRSLFYSLVLVLLAGVSSLAQPGPPDKSAAAAQTVTAAESQLAKETADGRREAYDTFLRAAELYREAGDKDNYAQALTRAGLAAQDLGEREKAIKLYSQALPIFRDIGNRLWTAKTLNSMGVSHGTLGNYNSAVDLFSEALRILREIDDFDEAIVVINNLGRLCEETGNFQKALDFYNLALPYAEKNRDDERLGRLLGNAGGVYQKLGDPKKALETFERALALHRKVGNRRSEASTINNIGNIYFEMGDAPRALDLMGQALPLAVLTGDARTEATILSNFMDIYRLSGNRRAAIFFGKQAVNKYQQLRGMVRGLAPGIQKIYLGKLEEYYRRLADMLIEAGQFEQASQVLRMLKEEEYTQFVQRDLEEMKALGQRVALTPVEQALLDRYLAIYQRITAAGLDYVALEDRKRKEGELSETDKAAREKLSAEVNDANAAMKLFMEKQLSQELGLSEVAKIEYDRNLQTRLRGFPEGTVALYTVVTPERYRVILTTTAVQVDGKTEITAAELNKKIFAFRELLRNPAADPRPAGKELYDILIKPVEKQLDGAGAKMLAWSLDGALRYIPIGALSPDGKTFLAEKYQTAVLTPKTRDGISDTTKPWQVLGLGVSRSISVTDPANSDMMITFRALPGAKRELERIVRDQGRPGETGILAGKRFLDADFTSRTLPDFLATEPKPGQSRFTVLHVASHFRLGSDWKNSFLLLGDGNVLTLQQLSSTLPVTFGDIDLVTLSACNTAAAADSSGKEIDSLAEAIQAKGGKAILATLWSISDEGTSQLMAEFYRSRKDTPSITKAEALQLAQRAMIGGGITLSPDLAARLRPRGTPPAGTPAYPFDETRPFAHPYYWSPFVLIGNWR
jgi:CHAT domain-containing protein/Tfp pilus assembly protein PilF